MGPFNEDDECTIMPLSKVVWSKKAPKEKSLRVVVELEQLAIFVGVYNPILRNI